MALLRRAGLTLAILLGLALLASGPGLADHDDEHPYAGNWTIDPTGVPGKLKLAVVAKAAGLAAIRAISPSRADDCEVRYPNADYYSGSFTTPNDNGPIAGCSTPFGSFDGIYISRMFAPNGPYGNFDIIDSNAFITAPGEPEPIFGGKQVALRFDGHFKGDGADDSIIITWSIRQEGIGTEEFGLVSHLLDHVSSSTQGGGKLELTLKSATTDCGCGRVEPVPGAALDNVLEHVDKRFGVKRRVALKVTSGIAWGAWKARDVPDMRLNVQVIGSNSASCPVGRRGTVEFVEFFIGNALVRSLAMDLCGETHSHVFYGWRDVGTVAYTASVAFPPQKKVAADLTPVKVRFSVQGSHTREKYGLAKLSGAGSVRGPVSGKLAPVGQVQFVHTDAKGDREHRIAVVAAYLRGSSGNNDLYIVGRIVKSNEPGCRVDKFVELRFVKFGSFEQASYICSSTHAHLFGRGFSGHQVNIDLAVSK